MRVATSGRKARTDKLFLRQVIGGYSTHFSGGMSDLGGGGWSSG